MTQRQLSKLIKKWDETLTISGFQDAEKWAGNKRVLINPSNPFRHGPNEGSRAGKEEYSRIITHKLIGVKWNSQADKFIMTARSEGWTIKDTCVFLKAKGLKHNRETVRLVIQKYERLWGLRK